MQRYNPNKIEKKWQKYWETKKIYNTKDEVAQKKNKMILTEFAYPSGNLHIGHWYAFTLPDIKARYLRMKGYNVMYPTGFDAFGLPAENAAIKNNIHPEKWTRQNIAYMVKQLKSMGTMFDWSRKVSTIDPDYYKWTQWMFIQLYNGGLAYRAPTRVNWCPKDKTVLANEQVVNGKCERCGFEVVQKELTQWMFKITEFRDELIDDLKNLDWQEAAKISQINWVGRSEGANIKFNLTGITGKEDGKHFVEVFTTRADTLFGVTAIIISPELAQKWINVGWQASEEVKNYIKKSLAKRELERQENKEKTGIDAGIFAINPANHEKVPVFVADYVLGHYGTGAAMFVPAHDERDFEFAKKYNLPVKEIIVLNGDKEILVNSMEFDGMDSKKAKDEIVKFVGGKKVVQHKLRDWVLSRQRYWGVPIPMVHCLICGYQPVSEKELPIKLPPLKDFKPADDGRSPLFKAKKWLKVKCPKCKGLAERETDTMDTFVDSSWYFMRYADPKNKKIFASKEKMKKWLPVFSYLGGAEHTTMHLLYSRFFAKALHKLGYVDFSEPFLNRRNRGIILGPDNQKMSKSRGNVVDPDNEVKKYGADAVRIYLAFMGPYLNGGSWNSNGITGAYRFLNRVFNFVMHYDAKTKTNPKATDIINKYIKVIGEDINDLNFNTGVSGLMKLLNELELQKISKKEYETFLKLLAPFAPHLSEELWQSVLKNKISIHLEEWPQYNEQLIKEEQFLLIIQINGKVRDKIEVSYNIEQKEAEKIALNSLKTKSIIGANQVKKIVFVPNKIINIVV